jgi:hypothetical protein
LFHVTFFFFEFAWHNLLKETTYLDVTAPTPGTGGLGFVGGIRHIQPEDKRSVLDWLSRREQFQ